jgi:hypothetical protein
MNIMTLSEFILSDETVMKDAVLHQGVLVAKRRNSESLVFLFQMDGYYVETICSMKSKAVNEYRAFQNINALQPYLEEITIDHLFQ